MAHRFAHFIAGLSLLVSVSLPSALCAQAVDEKLWAANGLVKSVVRSGDKIYLGGSFAHVGPATGAGAPLDATTGLLPASFPKVVGEVYAVAPDGSGGWYIGGDFTSVGKQPRTNIAQVAGDMTVTAWTPQANGVVRALAVNGSNVIVGGDFDLIGGMTRVSIAALDATTGGATSWDPHADNTVSCLALSGSTVYVGGAFGTIGGSSRSCLAALDLTSGVATAWNPNPNDNVWAIAVGASVVYVGGGFTTMGGQPRNYIAALDGSSGGVASWNPNANNWVYSLAVNGSTVYAGGLFTNIGGQARNGIAALSVLTGAATSWNPNVGAGGYVLSLLVSGSKVYAGGTFSSMGGATRYNLASVDATTGLADAWDPHASGVVRAIAMAGSMLYAGGGFDSMNGKARNNLACLDALTGAATAWDPNANSTVNAIVVSGDSIYVGGLFTSVGGQARNQIARLDGTGAAMNWNPAANGEVSCLALGPGRVYAGGFFTTIAFGSPRNRIAAIDPVSGSIISWNPNANGAVLALKVDASNVYVGGMFTFISGVARNHIARLTVAGGGASGWAPSLTGGLVRALALNGRTVYAGGDFAFVNGTARLGLAAIDSTGAPTAFDPQPTGVVYALAVDGSRLYVGGGFDSFAEGFRNRLAAFDIPSGSLTSWDPNGNDVATCFWVSGSTVYAGGYFTTIAGDERPRLVALQASPEISGVQPASGGNGGGLTLSVTGRNLVSGAVLSLRRAAPPSQLLAVTTTVAGDGASLSASVDLTGAAAGVWDVVVQNPDLQTVTLSNGFTITAVQAPQLQIAVLGPEPIRASYPTAFDLVIENPGNVDAFGVPVYLYGIPVSATFGLDFTISPAPQAGGEPDWSQSPYTFSTGSGQVIAFVIPRVPPGTTVRRFTLNVPASTPQFQLGAAVTPKWSGNGPLLGCLASMALLSNTGCDATYLASINSYLAANPQLDAVGGLGIWAKGMWACEGAATLSQANGKAGLVIGTLENYAEHGSPPAGCEDAFLATWQQVRTIHVVTSIDPNDKLSPPGLISATQAIPYSIRFENLAQASASARQVTVVDQLGPNLDLNSFSLDAIDLFGTVHLLPTPGAKNYTHDVDLGQNNLMVRVSASLDVPSRQITWLFTTLDKTTQLPPSNGLLGFLPPNATPPQGEGSVLFTIRTLGSTPNGTTIQNSAVLNFDGSAQTTPTVANTLDTAAPSSNVLALGTPISTSSFPVSWTATGAPADLRDFTVYVSEDGAPYQAWKVNTTSTSDTYVPRPGGHSYFFYSVARDQNGNIEAPPATPDAQTQSTTAVEAGLPGALALMGARPNPAHGSLRIAFALPSAAPATLELIDIAGRRVARRDVTSLGAGHHELTFDSPAHLKAGLYFVRLAQAGQVLTARVVLMR